MSYWRNDAINRVNLHTTVQALAQSAGGVFFFVLLLRAGISVPHSLLSMAGIFAIRFVLRPLVLPVAIRFGLKPLMIVGGVFMALQYPILAEIDGIGPMLFALVAVLAVADILYWVAYNAYFAAIGDPEHRGHQIGAREAMVSLTGIVGPFVGAWALVTAGTRTSFAIVAVVQALSVLPLFAVPNVAVTPHAAGMVRSARKGALLYALDGWFDAAFLFVWQMALFLALGENIPAYGGAMALAGLVAAAFSLLLGRHVDLGHGRRAVALAYGIAAAVTTLRVLALGAPWLAVIANACGAVVLPLILPALGTATYNLAKASPDPFRFSLVAEGGWDVGCGVCCVLCAVLIAMGAPLSAALLLALPALGIAMLVLWRYFPARGMALPAPAQTMSR